MTRPRVLYVQYGNPGAYPPLEHSARLLIEAGCEVLVLGTVRPGDRLHFDAGRSSRLELLPMPPPGWRQKVHYARFLTWVMGWSRRFQPTWFYVSDPLAAPAALALQRLSAARLIYHEHDSPGDAAASSRAMRAVRAARAALARRADLCLLPNEQRARRFAAETGAAHVLTVWNCPTRHEVVDTRPFSTSGPLRVLYHGSIVPARLPLAAIEALAETPDVTLEIAGYGTAGFPAYLTTLQERAQTLGLEDRVTCAGTVPSRDALLAHAAAAHVGLALLPTDTADFNEQHMVGASNKPFDYLACGLALLVGERPEWRATYVDAGCALTCDPGSAASVAAAFRWFGAHRVETQAMGERGRQRILSEWNYERAFSPVLDRMSAGPRPAPALVPRYSAAESDAGRH